MLAAFREFAEFGVGGDEAGICEDRDGAREAALPFAHRLVHPPLAAFGDADFGRGVALHRAGDLAGEAAGVVRVVEAYVIDLPALRPQLFGEVAHCRKD